MQTQSPPLSPPPLLQKNNQSWNTIISSLWIFTWYHWQIETHRIFVNWFYKTFNNISLRVSYVSLKSTFFIIFAELSFVFLCSALNDDVIDHAWNVILLTKINGRLLVSQNVAKEHKKEINNVKTDIVMYIVFSVLTEWNYR